MTRKKKPSNAKNGQMVMRMVAMRSDTIDDNQRSVEVVVATENPVERFDYSRNQVIREILLMDGVEFRTSKRQLPIVDSHDRSTVRNILGSVRNLRTEGDALVGDAMFASDEESQVAFRKLSEGHITDFSITATPNETRFIPSGESETIRSQTIDGPAEVVTRWRPTDASLVATGADERSTVRDSLRRSYELANQPEGVIGMSPALIETLNLLGMPEDITGEEDIQAWLVQSLEKPAEEPAEEAVENNAQSDEPEMAVAGVSDEADSEVASEVDRALAADRERQREIRALCTRFNIERELADKLCDEGMTVNNARKVVLERMESKPVGNAEPVVTGSSIDRLSDAVRDGLIERAMTASGCRTPAFSSEKPAASGAEDFRHMSLLRMAERMLEAGGIDTGRLPARDIASIAMGNTSKFRSLGIRREDPAYHVTGTFSNLLQDAANKTLLAGYDEAPYTWSLWCRQAQSVSDFKSIKRNRFSEAPDMDVVPENTPYPEGAMSDDKESYSIEKYGQIFSCSWETIVNDDLDAISRVPAMHGNAARRTQNKKVYEVLTANAAMADGGALFNTTAQATAGGHANLASSGAVISVASLNAAFTSMMTKKGLNDDVTINVQPAFLIVPAAIAATALQVVGSIADPSAGGSSATGNSNTLNIYGPNGSRPLQVVADPVLDANSATAWYLAASPAQIDTVELSFLAGEETPALDTEFDFSRDVWRYKVRQTFGVAPIDFRGLFKNPGA